MKALLSAALITLSAASMAGPNEKGHDFYEGPQSGNTATRLAGKVEGWFNYNEMANQQAAKPAPTLSQVGSFGVRSNAEEHEKRIKKQNIGSSVWIEQALVGRKSVYRVIINRSCNSVANSKPETGCAKVAK